MCMVFQKCITFFVQLNVSPTAVELEHIDAPPGERVGVLLHVTSTAWETCACLAADIFVDSKFQATIVHLYNALRLVCIGIIIKLLL